MLPVSEALGTALMGLVLDAPEHEVHHAPNPNPSPDPDPNPNPNPNPNPDPNPNPIPMLPRGGEGAAGWRVAQYNLMMAIPNHAALAAAALAEREAGT